ncbi:unnamed protein product [Cuscuta epithymum]|uniref:Uncharacterized protein n=1 Tax=Cuscuta epithymum TaxID=186058 RepID=A0AAV0FWI0_9ASTE|nr:unnamed protein product [Cuscuta epithymum]
MENREQEEEEEYMDADVDMSAAPVTEENNSKDLENMKKRLKEIEEESGALREMQAKVEKEMGGAQGLKIQRLLLPAKLKRKRWIPAPSMLVMWTMPALQRKCSSIFSLVEQ